VAADPGTRRRRVVIVGAGFGGLAAARKLRHANVDVTLIDRRNHHLFQPLLYQAAAGALSSSDCASPIRWRVRRAANTAVLMAEVTDVDAERRQVVLERGERVDYDSLVVACGAQTSYFGHDEWQEVTCGLKTLDDAIDMRSRFYGAFEEAERCVDDATRAQWLTFVVVGGGPTGVEIAGQLAITASTMKRDFRRIDARSARVILLDAGERVVAAFSEKLSGHVADQLKEVGVTVRESARATAIDADGVTFEVDGSSERIDSKTVIWAAGVHSVALTEAVARATGASTDRAGRIEVNPDLTVPGHPEVSVIGDVACLAGPEGRPLPGLATVAIQQARHVAKGLAAGQPGATTPFHYFDKGALAVVGRGKAVCAIRGLELSGRVAFFTYLGVHLYYLGSAPGGRIEVLVKWIGARFGERQSALIGGELQSVERSGASVQPSGGGSPGSEGSQPSAAGAEA
jgi:NADH dehydrogenase